jgi:hypothetical protein
LGSVVDGTKGTLTETSRMLRAFGIISETSMGRGRGT